MHLDTVELESFYESPLGQIASRNIRQRLRNSWPSVRGMSVMGLGFATPYLRPFQSEAQRLISICPAQQGVLHWPPQALNVCALADEAALPLPDLSVDRVIVAHALETTESLRPMLRQIWRVLTPSGRAVFIVPNRTSLWAQIETTPFGHGRPFSRRQLLRVMEDAMFSPVAHSLCLHMPPFGMRWLVRTGVRWEKMGFQLRSQLAGVHILEVSKEVAALIPTGGKRQRVPARTALAGHRSRAIGKLPYRLEDCLDDPEAKAPSSGHVNQ